MVHLEPGLKVLEINHLFNALLPTATALLSSSKRIEEINYVLANDMQMICVEICYVLFEILKVLRDNYQIASTKLSYIFEIGSLM